MIQLFIRVLLCISPVQCGTVGDQLGPVPYNTELECEEAGLKLLRDNPVGLRGRAVYCPKVVKPK